MISAYIPISSKYLDKTLIKQSLFDIIFLSPEQTYCSNRTAASAALNVFSIV